MSSVSIITLVLSLLVITLETHRYQQTVQQFSAVVLDNRNKQDSKKTTDQKRTAACPAWEAWKRQFGPARGKLYKAREYLKRLTARLNSEGQLAQRELTNFLDNAAPALPARPEPAPIVFTLPPPEAIKKPVATSIIKPKPIPRQPIAIDPAAMVHLMQAFEHTEYTIQELKALQRKLQKSLNEIRAAKKNKTFDATKNNIAVKILDHRMESLLRMTGNQIFSNKHDALFVDEYALQAQRAYLFCRKIMKEIQPDNPIFNDKTKIPPASRLEDFKDTAAATTLLEAFIRLQKPEKR